MNAIEYKDSVKYAVGVVLAISKLRVMAIDTVSMTVVMDAMREVALYAYGGETGKPSELAVY